MTLRDAEPQEISEAAYREFTGRDDPDQRFQIRRLCPCSLCSGEGRVDGTRCPDCRGEGRLQQLVATCGSPADLGRTLVELAHEGEFDDCPLGILEIRQNEERKGRWLVKPWLPSPRNLSDAGRVLATGRRKA